MPLSFYIGARSEDSLMLELRCMTVNGISSHGRLCLLSTPQDRLKRKPPRIAFGEDANTLREYMMDRRKPVTGDLLGIRRRIPRLNPLDVWLRHRLESKPLEGSALMLRSPRVTRLSVRGFRGFREDAVLNLAKPVGLNGSGLTIIVGANNTGKSTLWESFDAISRKFKNDVSFSEGRRNRNTPGGVRIRLEREDGSAFRLESIDENTSETRSEREAETGAEIPEIVVVPSRRQFQPSFSRSLIPQRDWMFGGQDYSRSRQADQFSQFTGRLFDLHNDEIKKQSFDALMKQVLGYDLNWTIDLAEGQYGQSYYLKVPTSTGSFHTSDGLGDGIISLLFIVNALYDSDPGTLLVFDEPELSLHPQLVRRLGSVISEFAADRQIVIFTHSPLLVAWDDIANGAEVARTYKVGEDSRLAQAGRDVIDDVSRARGGWKNPHVLGVDANEALFLDDNVIVVEGQEDAALLPVVFSQVGVAQTGTIFGWGSGGGDGNPRRIAALLHGLGFRKVAVLLDADKQSEVQAIAKLFPEFLATTIPADDIRDKPAHDSPGKSGLLDAKGRVVKPEFADQARATLESVVSFFE